MGNLSFEANQSGLKALFKGFGDVASVAITMSKGKGAPSSRGFGFVNMPDQEQALAAIAALDGREFMGRVLKVGPARPKTKVQVLNEPGTYRGGRRTRSYMKRQGLL